jgi:hypothetical protein
LQWIARSKLEKGLGKNPTSQAIIEKTTAEVQA